MQKAVVIAPGMYLMSLTIGELSVLRDALAAWEGTTAGGQRPTTPVEEQFAAERKRTAVMLYETVCEAVRTR